MLEPTPQPGRIASADALAAAYAEWERSAHANTYDNGFGANTTCARCKSPLNWDPSQELASLQALDCGSCKRIPGAPRPHLGEGIPVPEEEWRDISCEICHIPAGNSYYVEVSYWNQETATYQDVDTVSDLCAKCHEGRHGFEVVEELEASQAHIFMECTDCHGIHGTPSECIDCHDPSEGSGYDEHARHQSVDCTGCHDAGGLNIWKDTNMDSRYFGIYITRRFAHDLTSWPSHNLQTEVLCQRCHHPPSLNRFVVVPEVGCEACHQNGASLFWCNLLPHDPEPAIRIQPSP